MNSVYSMRSAHNFREIEKLVGCKTNYVVSLNRSRNARFTFSFKNKYENLLQTSFRKRRIKFIALKR